MPVRPQPAKLDGTSGAADTDDVGIAPGEVAQLMRERDALTAEVDVLRRRITELENNAAQVRNRLAWAIDSVQSLLDGKG